MALSAPWVPGAACSQANITSERADHLIFLSVTTVLQFKYSLSVGNRLMYAHSLLLVTGRKISGVCRSAGPGFGALASRAAKEAAW